MSSSTATWYLSPSGDDLPSGPPGDPPMPDALCPVERIPVAPGAAGAGPATLGGALRADWGRTIGPPDPPDPINELGGGRPGDSGGPRPGSPSSSVKHEHVHMDQSHH
jgi:hypothetical protein